MNDLLLLVPLAHLVIGFGVFWVGVCRIAHMGSDTLRSVRWSTSSASACGVGVAVLPLLPAEYERVVMAAFGLSVLWLIFSWKPVFERGVPHQLTRGGR